jgi:hypothetical protein
MAIKVRRHFATRGVPLRSAAPAIQGGGQAEKRRRILRRCAEAERLGIANWI